MKACTFSRLVVYVLPLDVEKEVSADKALQSRLTQPGRGRERTERLIVKLTKP